MKPRPISLKKNPLEQQVSIDGSMGKLNALFALPALEEKEGCPIVIFSHGFGGDLYFHLWAPIIDVLLQHGVGTIRFDFNGCGKSEGKFQNMTVSNEIDDLMNVIGFANARGARSVSLVGHSQGGVVSGMAAGRCGATQIKSLILLSAAAVLRDDALRGITQGASFNPWKLDQESYELPRGQKLGRNYIQDAMNLPIYRETAAYDGPALILNGMADLISPYTYAQRYHKALRQSELIIAPGEDHLWSNNPAHVCQLCSQWLLARLDELPVQSAAPNQII